jgi:CRISPR/Cas system-associated exonuclease Cas4 (RecB family)
MILTKTDFKEYLLCDKSLWLKKNKPELYTAGEFSLFLQKILKDGDEVESHVQKLFPEGVILQGSNKMLVHTTKELLEQKGTLFQATFETAEGLFAKVDILKWNTETEKWDIYEVKASTEIKSDFKHNHLKDVAFQVVVCEEALGQDLVGESYIIYINKDYRRGEFLNLQELFVTENVTLEVKAILSEVRTETATALQILSKEEISYQDCPCLYRTTGQRCDTFFFFNPDVPAYAVHNIVSGKKLSQLIDERVFRIEDIPEDMKLTLIQAAKVDLVKSGVPRIDHEAIRSTLDKLEFPLYFLDYETLAKPIPPLQGYKPNQAIVFQVSVHKLESDGTLEHFEYLAEDIEHASAGLVEMLGQVVGPTGHIIVWYESFEKGRNVELSELHPEASAFFLDMNNRIFDLMKVFTQHYADPAFGGSFSIKNVLPVMLPELTYKSLEIQNGTMALSEWEKMVTGQMTDEYRAQTRENLLRYCELDTRAMVELYNILQKKVGV